MRSPLSASNATSVSRYIRRPEEQGALQELADGSILWNTREGLGTVTVTPRNGLSESNPDSTHQWKNARSLLKCRWSVVGFTHSRRLVR